MNKKVIYTCLVGKYDTLQEPKYVMQGWDYICFSDEVKNKKSSIWQIRPIPYSHFNKQILSRYPKLNPHLLLKEYKYSLWLDANLVIVSEAFERAISKRLNEEAIIAIPKHPQRNCIYEEADACIFMGKEYKWNIKKQIRYLQDKNYPSQLGLFENNIILRQHNTPQIIKLSNEWWIIYLKFSKRDQLSLRFLLWKYQIDCIPLFDEGYSAQNFPGLNYKLHQISRKQRLIFNIRKFINRYILS